MTLGILDGLPRLDGSPESVHRAIEAMKLAYADGKRYIAEPGAMEYTAGQLLSGEYLASRRALIGREALLPAPGTPDCGGTVYFCTADAEGNMVSWIQSNYNGFGSGVVIPGTGIALHDRGCNFSLDPASPNCMAPGKRPYHTIIPGFLTRDGQPVGPFGVDGRLHAAAGTRAGFDKPAGPGHEPAGGPGHAALAVDGRQGASSWRRLSGGHGIGTGRARP